MLRKEAAGAVGPGKRRVLCGERDEAFEVAVERERVRPAHGWEEGPVKHPDLLVTPLRSAVCTLVVRLMLSRVELYDGVIYARSHVMSSRQGMTVSKSSV